MTNITASVVMSTIRKIQEKGYLKGAYKEKGGAEDAVEKAFLDAGLIGVKRKSKIEKRKKGEKVDDKVVSQIILEIENMPKYSIMAQPFGANNNPDFVIRLSNTYINVELKSSATARKPTYNSAIPKSTTIYLFSTPKCSTFYQGSAICNIEQRDEIIAERKKRAAECLLGNEKLAKITHRNGSVVSDYNRPMFRFHGFDILNPENMTKNEKEVEELIDYFFTEDAEGKRDGTYSREDELEYIVE